VKSDIFSLGLLVLWLIGKEEQNYTFAESFYALKYHHIGVTQRIKDYLRPYAHTKIKHDKDLTALQKILTKCIGKFPTSRPTLEKLTSTIVAVRGDKKIKWKFEFKEAPGSCTFWPTFPRFPLFCGRSAADSG
jgi:hypothetical protein